MKFVIVKLPAYQTIRDPLPMGVSITCVPNEDPTSQPAHVEWFEFDLVTGVAGECLSTENILVIAPAHAGKSIRAMALAVAGIGGLREWSVNGVTVVPA